MRRLTWLVVGIALLIVPHSVLAQRRGGRGGGGMGGPGRAPTGTAATPDDSKAFKRAIALQASPEQAPEFQQLTKSMQAARKDAQNLLQLAGNAGDADMFREISTLSNAVDEAQTDNERFLRDLSSVQESGLKDFTKKLGKANSEVTKQNKALRQGLEPSGIESKQLMIVLQKLEKALADLQTEELALGGEMGLPGKESSQ